MYSEKCICAQFILALAFSAAEAKWLLKMFAITTGFATAELLRFDVLGTLVEVCFTEINDFISFKVFLILFQLDSENIEK